MDKENWSQIDLGNPRAVLEKALSLWHPRIALASSFSLEDAVVTHLLMEIRKDAVIFALDTGRLNPETYECAEVWRRRYGLRIEWYFPERVGVEDLERKKGLFSFRDSIENRKECCGIRRNDKPQKRKSSSVFWRHMFGSVFIACQSAIHFVSHG